MHRNLEKTLGKYLKLPQILAIVGPRRSGKTTFLLHLKKRLPSSVFLSFEDERVLELFEKDLDSFAKLYLQPNKTLIIDEFQYARSGGKSLKYLFDFYPEKKIIISGSSSLELTVKVAKFLVGRILSFPLFPFSFDEFIRAKKPQLEDLIMKKKQFSEVLFKQVEPFLNEYLIYGGYPEVVLADDFTVKQTLLQNIYQLYFLKDVSGLAQLAEDWKLKNLTKIIAANIGGVVNYSQTANIAQIDFRTLKSYLNFLEKTFIIFPVSPFFTNKNKEIVKNPKIYFVDLGLRNSLLNSFDPVALRQEGGYLLENFVAANLLRKGSELHFWRTKAKAEVDFVIIDKNQTLPIEVKSHLVQAKISRSLKSFLEHYQPAKAYVANLGFFGKKNIGKTTVNFTPIFHSFIA